MQNFQAAVAPLAALAAAVALSWFEPRVDGLAGFAFIWDVLLGAALGACLAAMPSLSGFVMRRNALTGMYWACGFVSLLLIFYQYMTTVTGMRIESLGFLAAPGPRMRIAEGVMLGYASLTAGRGKS